MKTKKKPQPKRDPFLYGAHTFSVYKECEGGIGQKHALELLKGAGIPARRGYSPFIGQTGVEIPDTVKNVKRARRLLFGRG